jgi:hypothetical protein
VEFTRLIRFSTKVEEGESSKEESKDRRVLGLVRWD